MTMLQQHQNLSALAIHFTYMKVTVALEPNGKERHAGIDPAHPPVPQMLTDCPGLRLWHHLDSVFRTPRTTAYFIICMPPSYASPKAAAATRLALRLLKDSLNEMTYMADIADLEYSVGLIFMKSCKNWNDTCIPQTTHNSWHVKSL